VLVVEDDRAFSSLVVRAIEGAGYTCAAVSDGRAALDWIATNRADLVVLDLLLPKKDGRSVLATLQADEATRDIPVVVMSGVFRGRATTRELQDAGAQGFLEKPFPTRDLIAELQALIGPAQGASVAKDDSDEDRVSLAENPPAALLWEAMEDCFTGAVQFRRGKLHKVIVLDGGTPRQVRSNSAHECLGRRLLKAGRIDKTALDESLRRTKADGVRQGEVLVEMGVISQEDIDKELAAQSEDKLLDVFGWDDGEGWRQPGVKKISYASEIEGWTPRLVVFRGVSYMNSVRAIAELAPLVEASVVLDESDLSAEEKAIPEIEKALAVIEPGVTVAELLESHGAALYALSLTGTIQLVEATDDSAFAASEGKESDPAVRAEITALKRELEGQDHFQRLGLDRSATSKDARSAFLNLAKRYHPDRYSGEEEDVRTLVSEAFALMSAAHDTLADKDERNAYLSRLESGVSDEENREALRRIVNAEQRFNQGEALFKQRAYTKALAVFAEILQVEPDESEFHAYFGWTHYLAHHGDAAAKRLAREHLEKAIQLAPQSPTGYYFLGQLLKACNDPTRARKMFKKVMELRPGHVEAERELRLIEMRKGKGDKSGGGIFGFGRKKK